MGLIDDGNLVYIIHDKRRQWVRKVEANTQFHSDRGFINYNDLIGKPFGTTFLIEPNHLKVALLKPTLSDIIFHMKRESQIIYPEDIGLILTYGNIKAGVKVLEAGAGSGTVSGIMGIYAQPDGHVHSFDIRENAIQQARKNVAQMNITEFVDIQFGNILEESFDLPAIEFIMLDLATPWDAVHKVKSFLSQEGVICLFSPTVEQVKKNVRALHQHGFSEIITLEQLLRTFQVKPNATRPRGRMVGHSGYLTFGKLTGKFFPPSYNDLYSPSNIGNLLIYGDLRPDHKNLIVTYDGSPIISILSKYIGSNDNLYHMLLPQKPTEDEIQTAITQLKATLDLEDLSELFGAISIDSIIHPDLIALFDSFLIKSGVFSALSPDFEHMKAMFDQLELQKYYRVGSSELICRKIQVDLEADSTFSQWIPQKGYLSFGRKVVDEIGDLTKTPKEPEFVEVALDVGVDFAADMEPEPDKIDYANIRE